MSKKHAHKYYRAEVAGTRVWACALPDCTHYMPKHMEGLVLGKKAICWTCNEEFILDSEALKEDKPRCANCRSGIKSEDDLLREYLTTIPKD